MSLELRSLTATLLRLVTAAIDHLWYKRLASSSPLVLARPHSLRSCHRIRWGRQSHWRQYTWARHFKRLSLPATTTKTSPNNTIECYNICQLSSQLSTRSRTPRLMQQLSSPQALSNANSLARDHPCPGARASKESASCLIRTSASKTKAVWRVPSKRNYLHYRTLL